MFLVSFQLPEHRRPPALSKIVFFFCAFYFAFRWLRDPKAITAQFSRPYQLTAAREELIVARCVCVCVCVCQGNKRIQHHKYKKNTFVLLKAFLTVEQIGRYKTSHWLVDG